MTTMQILGLLIAPVGALLIAAAGFYYAKHIR
ncbi:hypothetical protein C7477_12524 [Phyllobacterium leguminum]|uniref:Uncharacterized protein n=1 Tax=Phyllobacterium leguminum TaxID=314237 RepID=A0A318SWT5_9HYPH|nr:hypothetical protein C7477_12524 [Phyllobacterium leguminum]